MQTTAQRWLVAVALVWAVALVAAVGWSAQRDPTTVREQSSIESGRQTVEQATEAIRSAAGAGVGIDVRPDEVDPACRITLARSGIEVDRVIAMSVPEGQEPALLSKLAERLPDGWGAEHFPTSDRLVADAGDYVAVRGEVAAPGEVHVTLGTGCRPTTP